MDRCEEDWHASDNNLRGTPPIKPEEAEIGQVAHRPPLAAVLYHDLEANDMVRAWHGHGMARFNQTRPHCVIQMGMTHSKPLAARHGMGTAWARHAVCESAFIRSGRLIHRERDFGVYRIRDDVGPAAGLDVSEKGTLSFLC